MHPVLQRALENERERTQVFRDKVSDFDERCSEYLRGLWGFSPGGEDEEEEEEEPEDGELQGDIEDTLSNLS